MRKYILLYNLKGFKVEVLNIHTTHFNMFYHLQLHS